MLPSSATALGLLAGAAADAVLGDPDRGHPVAGFGAAAGALERRTWRDTRAAGAVHTAVCVGVAAGIGTLVERSARGPWTRVLTVGAATWTVVGGTSLRREAAAVRALLDANDLDAARLRLSALVGRDTTTLDESEMARAAIESVAENTSDAVVAPLLWGAVAGVPGLLGYRAVNTLDAMIGHRSPRYARFGWAAARLDDAANLLPSRTTAALVALLSGRPREVWQVVRADARAHPSPNAGWCEAAFAGALELRLGGTNVYEGRTEERAEMGTGKPPTRIDIARANAMARRVAGAAAVVSAALALALAGRRNR